MKVVKWSVNKILNHISYARDWLNKAENQVCRGSLIEGELYLSLAEAEVHKAWETSLLSRKGTRKKMGIKISTIISALMVVFLLVSGFYFLRDYLYREASFSLNIAERYQESVRVNKGNDPRLINVNLYIENERGS